MTHISLKGEMGLVKITGFLPVPPHSKRTGRVSLLVGPFPPLGGGVKKLEGGLERTEFSGYSEVWIWYKILSAVYAVHS